MKTRILVGLALVLVIPSVAFFFQWRAVRNISVQGKSIFEWAIQLNGPEGTQEAEKVIRQTGSAAVPPLITALEAKDSLFKKPFLTIAPSLPKRMRTSLHRTLNPNEKGRLRLGAVRALALLGPIAKPAVPALARAMKDENPEIAMRAAFALGRLGSSGVPRLIDAMNSKRDSTRLLAIQGLGLAGREAREASPELIRALQDSNRKIAEQALDTLRRFGEGPHITSLAEMLRNPELRIRILAARTLAAVGPQARAAIPALVEAERQNNNLLREYVIDALGRIQPSNPEVASVLRIALRDGDAKVRVRAADGLNYGGAAAGSAVPVLTEALKDGDVEVRRSVITALGTIASQNQTLNSLIIPEVTSGLDDSDFLVRILAAKALARLGPSAAASVESLKAALDDSNPGVRSWAALALGAVGPLAHTAQSALSDLLSDPDKAVVSAAREALKKIGMDSPARCP